MACGIVRGFIEACAVYGMLGLSKISALPHVYGVYAIKEKLGLMHVLRAMHESAGALLASKEGKLASACGSMAAPST